MGSEEGVSVSVSGREIGFNDASHRPTAKQGSSSIMPVAAEETLQSNLVPTDEQITWKTSSRFSRHTIPRVKLHSKSPLQQQIQQSQVFESIWIIRTMIADAKHRWRASPLAAHFTTRFQRSHCQRSVQKPRERSCHVSKCRVQTWLAYVRSSRIPDTAMFVDG